MDYYRASGRTNKELVDKLKRMKRERSENEREEEKRDVCHVVPSGYMSRADICSIWEYLPVTYLSCHVSVLCHIICLIQLYYTLTEYHIIKSDVVHRAMLAVDRGDFSVDKSEAYQDIPHSIGTQEQKNKEEGGREEQQERKGQKRQEEQK